VTTTTATTNTSSTATTNSSSQAAALTSGQATLSSSYTTFLKLLTTQLQHQDPTSPLDTNAFTQQLVQMTGVQQQLLSNELLQKLVNQSGGGQGVTGSVGLIGKAIVANTADNTLSGGSATWQYQLGTGAVQGTATITNAAGTAVWSGDLNSLNAGSNTFTWNGKDASGRQLPDGGPFTLNIAATNSKGGSVTATTQVTGVVTGVQQDASGATVLAVGKTTVPVSSVTSVTTPA
jgi:flagellar basal-body rod modification protein FlgD